MILGGNVSVLFLYALNLRDFVVSLLLQLRISCPIRKIAPLVLINDSNRMRMYLTLVWKMLKLNWLDGWPSWRNSRRRTLIRSRRLNSQTLKNFWIIMGWVARGVHIYIYIIFIFIFVYVAPGRREACRHAQEGF
ncbi:hypothetical protein AMTRI_Chr01g113000 [Amborella trichopoda]